jgi:hypothetical protein
MSIFSGVNNPGLDFVQFTASELAFISDIGAITASKGDMLYYSGTHWTNLAIGSTNKVLTVASGLPSWVAPSSTANLVVGTSTISSGTNTSVLFDNSGVLGEYTISGSGNVAMTTSPSFTTPALGVATATTVNKVTLTAPATGSTLTIADGKTLTVSNTLTLAGTDSTTMTFPTTSATIARTDASNTFTGHQTIEGVTSTGATGSGLLVFATSPTLTTASLGSSTAMTQTQLDGSTKVATTSYVDTAVANAIAGVNPAVAVQYATTAAGQTSGLTYSNGVSGVGATMTGANNTVTTIDGHAFVVGDVGVTRVLIKNDTQSPSGAFNGVYLFTALHTAGTGDVFTRALDYDQPSDINNTGAIPVISGTANTGTSWVQTSNIVSVGVTPLTYVQFGINPSGIVTAVSIATANGFSGSSSGGTTPALTIVAGAIVPTTVNGLTITTTAGTLTIANSASASLITSGNFGLTLTSTATTNSTFPSGTHTLAGLDVAQSWTAVQTFTNSDIKLLGSSTGATTFTSANAGASNFTITIPAATDTLAVLGTAQTFTAQEKFNNIVDVNNAITASSNAATVPVTFRLNTVTNNSAATLTITMTTTSAVDGQMTVVRILDSSAAAQTITWVNTENSTVSAPTTSNGSTTLFLTVGFIYNGGTSKWRCIANA